MKKLFAILMTIALLATMMTSAMAAYTAITPANNSIKHSLTLTEANATSLLYDITYAFTVSDPVVIGATDNGVTNAGNAVTGKPAIASVTYGPADNFSATNKTATKDLAVDWSAVRISEPGVYRWTVTQAYSTTAPQAPSNASATFYLYMYVTDNAGELQTTFILSKTETVGTGKNGTLAETYPAKTVNLTITKTVDGNQASKDQYFPFTIKLTAPNSVTATKFWYTIEATTAGSYDIAVPATAYHAAQANPQTIGVTQGTTGEFTLWLKHGQSVTIKDMVYGTEYYIVEGGNDGYTVSATATGHTDGFTYADMKAADDSLTDNAIVSYTNTKSATVPTGIVLQSGAAFAGIVLAMAMMAVVFTGKRKENA